jgi:CDP-diacylglycerol--glycerol-3-phosphate 3-phosphatidyltransferase
MASIQNLAHNAIPEITGTKYLDTIGSRNSGSMTFSPNASISNRILIRLRAKWWVAVGLCFLIQAGGFLLLGGNLERPNASQWILQSTVITIYELALLRFGLNWNYHPAQKVLRSTLGYGTWLTIVRGALIAILAGFLFQPWPASKFFPGRFSWAPGLLYITASLLDFLDGRAARACRHETRLGAFLDINLDALGLLIAPLVAVGYGQLPAAYLSVGFAYYVYIAGIALRKKFSKPVVEPGPWRGARIIAGFQMGFVGIALLPVVKPPATTLAAYLVMLPLLAGFIRDWMIVCGYWKPGSFFNRWSQHAEGSQTK